MYKCECKYFRMIKQERNLLCLCQNGERTKGRTMKTQSQIQSFQIKISSVCGYGYKSLRLSQDKYQLPILQPSINLQIKIHFTNICILYLYIRPEVSDRTTEGRNERTTERTKNKNWITG